MHTASGVYRNISRRSPRTKVPKSRLQRNTAFLAFTSGCHGNGPHQLFPSIASDQAG